MWGATKLLTVFLVLAGVSVPALALDASPCRIGIPGAPKVLAECSTLSVPENPAEPDGTMLDLAVVRIPALAAAPLADPLVLIQGGPGGSSINLYLQLRNALVGVRRSRDIIVMDQRGTGQSAAGLECATPKDIDFETAPADLLDQLVEECLGSLERDARFYTTSVAVRDLDALREAFGIERWNIYGVSYGTRVAQHYLRRYPQHVRSVVLDGSVPPTTVLGPGIAPAAQAALDAIFRRCADDSACSEQFGSVDGKFAALKERLHGGGVSVTRTNPLSGAIEEVPVSPDALSGLTRLMSYSTTTAALLPLMINEAFEGRYATLLAQSEMILGDVETAINLAMHNSVVCSEDWPRIDRDASALGESTYLGTAVTDALDSLCARWPVGPVDADFHDPVVSESPILFLSGANDPATPSHYVKAIIDGGLTNSLHIIVKHQGHGVVAIGCIPRIVEAFIDAASIAELDASCVEDVWPTPFFLTPAGPAP